MNAISCLQPSSTNGIILRIIERPVEDICALNKELVMKKSVVMAIFAIALTSVAYAIICDDCANCPTPCLKQAQALPVCGGDAPKCDPNKPAPKCGGDAPKCDPNKPAPKCGGDAPKCDPNKPAPKCGGAVDPNKPACGK